MKKTAALIISMFSCLTIFGQENVAEDYVLASIVYASPGKALYSRTGHAGIRMQCPEHSLDYVYSYESEMVSQKVLAFLAGKLKMGLLAIPTEEYLSQYREEGREAVEYELNLPIEAKQNLWRILDNHMMEGMDLPYDYLERGCAQATFRFLKEGVAPAKIDFVQWPETFNLSRRELSNIQLRSYPWTRFFLNLIVNGNIDAVCTNEQKVIMPADLPTVLKGASFDGKPILEGNGTILVEGKQKYCSQPWVTPLFLTLILLMLTLACLFFGKNWMEIPLLVIQSAIGILTTYLVLFSALPCTQWSWLIIPFNPLPLIFWKWRRRWALPYGAICMAWGVVMLFLKHPVTDIPYAFLAICIAISSFASYINKKRSIQNEQ